jgi:hypothetical protein
VRTNGPSNRIVDVQTQRPPLRTNGNTGVTKLNSNPVQVNRPQPNTMPNRGGSAMSNNFKPKFAQSMNQSSATNAGMSRRGGFTR